MGFENVRFVTRNVLQLTAADVPSGSFDRLIGRLFLMYLPEPHTALRQCLPLLRAGAIVTFQELESRLRDEAVRCDASLAYSLGIGAWTRVPKG
jgi:hypothetical protein